ncbi:MAG: MerR family transcriptional regulator [Dactylosporangium sp.]|nr:MerR family transcriptional regulator [Dactylosporangium sp.]NNJ60677.1 MerR family transcriptional regulator [Dactylosporangium sp.]
MSIGEVLAHLRVDFPDTTISKLRFLEAEGLVEPRRTASGYRKFSGADVARLRYILTAQRDQYLPLRVIRQHLEALDPGEDSTPTYPSAGGQRLLRPPLSAVGNRPSAADPDLAVEQDLRLTRAELLTMVGLEESLLADLERFGLVRPSHSGRYDADALEVAAAAAQLATYGVEPRHLRAYRAAADREIGLFGQLVSPMARQPGPAARARAAETLRELAALTQRIHAALVRAGLRQTLGR